MARRDGQSTQQQTSLASLEWGNPAPLNQIWQLYCRHFGVDHWFRFAEQRLHWTLP